MNHFPSLPTAEQAPAGLSGDFGCSMPGLWGHTLPGFAGVGVWLCRERPCARMSLHRPSPAFPGAPWAADFGPGDN